jgi:hypothetical protein
MAAKKRVNIAIDPETLRLADRTARRRKISRSESIRAAIYDAGEVENRRAADQKRCARQRRAIEGMQRLAHHFGDWQAEQILRAARGWDSVEGN